MSEEPAALRSQFAASNIDRAKARMKAMIPTWDEDTKLPTNAARFEQVRRKTNELLQLG